MSEPLQVGRFTPRLLDLNEYRLPILKAHEIRDAVAVGLD
jgi:hypothetical protein